MITQGHLSKLIESVEKEFSYHMTNVELRNDQEKMDMYPPNVDPHGMLGQILYRIDQLEKKLFFLENELTKQKMYNHEHVEFQKHEEKEEKHASTASSFILKI